MNHIKTSCLLLVLACRTISASYLEEAVNENDVENEYEWAMQVPDGAMDEEASNFSPEMKIRKRRTAPNRPVANHYYDLDGINPTVSYKLNQTVILTCAAYLKDIYQNMTIDPSLQAAFGRLNKSAVISPTYSGDDVEESNGWSQHSQYTITSYSAVSNNYYVKTAHFPATLRTVAYYYVCGVLGSNGTLWFLPPYFNISLVVPAMNATMPAFQTPSSSSSLTTTASPTIAPTPTSTSATADTGTYTLRHVSTGGQDGGGVYDTKSKKELKLLAYIGGPVLLAACCCAVAIVVRRRIRRDEDGGSGEIFYGDRRRRAPQNAYSGASESRIKFEKHDTKARNSDLLPGFNFRPTSCLVVESSVENWHDGSDMARAASISTHSSHTFDLHSMLGDDYMYCDNLQPMDRMEMNTLSPIIGSKADMMSSTPGGLQTGMVRSRHQESSMLADIDGLKQCLQPAGTDEYGNEAEMRIRSSWNASNVPDIECGAGNWVADDDEYGNADSKGSGKNLVLAPTSNCLLDVLSGGDDIQSGQGHVVYDTPNPLEVDTAVTPTKPVHRDSISSGKNVIYSPAIDIGCDNAVYDAVESAFLTDHGIVSKVIELSVAGKSKVSKEAKNTPPSIAITEEEDENQPHVSSPVQSEAEKTIVAAKDSDVESSDRRRDIPTAAHTIPTTSPLNAEHYLQPRPVEIPSSFFDTPSTQGSKTPEDSEVDRCDLERGAVRDANDCWQENVVSQDQVHQTPIDVAVSTL